MMHLRLQRPDSPDDITREDLANSLKVHIFYVFVFSRIEVLVIRLMICPLLWHSIPEVDKKLIVPVPHIHTNFLSMLDI